MGAAGNGSLAACGLECAAGNNGTRSSSITVTFSKAQAIPVASGPDPMEQLRKLGELRDAGVVSDAEFEAKKAELLARLRTAGLCRTHSRPILARADRRRCRSPSWPMSTSRRPPGPSLTMAE